MNTLQEREKTVEDWRSTHEKEVSAINARQSSDIEWIKKLMVIKTGL